MHESRTRGDDRPIGVFDTGVGGLTVLESLVAMLPHEDFLYVGDTLYNPYGSRTNEDIVALSKRVVQFFVEKNCKLIVIACNTISVVAKEALQSHTKIPIMGMTQGEHELLEMPISRVAVMATEATIRTHRHKETIENIHPHLSVIEIPCPRLADTIEEGHVDDGALEQVLAPFIADMQEKQAQAIVLGCTHFPLITEVLRKHMHGICCINPSYETAKLAKDYLAEHDRFSHKEQGKSVLYFTKIGEATHRLIRTAFSGEYVLEPLSI